MHSSNNYENVCAIEENYFSFMFCMLNKISTHVKYCISFLLIGKYLSRYLILSLILITLHYTTYKSTLQHFFFPTSEGNLNSVIVLSIVIFNVADSMWSKIPMLSVVGIEIKFCYKIINKISLLTHCLHYFLFVSIFYISMKRKKLNQSLLLKSKSWRVLYHTRNTT